MNSQNSAEAMSTERKRIALDRISPDDKNRTVTASEEFQSLVDSVRVLGVLQPVHVRSTANGKFELIDGERRWRAAHAAGLVEIPCEVWPADANPRDAQIAGIVLNEQRQPHSPIHVARRLGEIKNDYGLTHEQLSKHTGMPADRVKSYLALLGAGTLILEFLESSDTPVKVALELVRYERATDTRRTEKLLKRQAEAPLTRHQIAALRKQATTHDEELPSRVAAPLASRVEKALTRNLSDAISQIETALAKFGYEVSLASGAQGS